MKNSKKIVQLLMLILSSFFINTTLIASFTIRNNGNEDITSSPVTYSSGVYSPDVFASNSYVDSNNYIVIPSTDSGKRWYGYWSINSATAFVYPGDKVKIYYRVAGSAYNVKFIASMRGSGKTYLMGTVSSVSGSGEQQVFEWNVPQPSVFYTEKISSIWVGFTNNGSADLKFKIEKFEPYEDLDQNNRISVPSNGAVYTPSITMSVGMHNGAAAFFYNDGTGAVPITAWGWGAIGPDQVSNLYLDKVLNGVDADVVRIGTVLGGSVYNPDLFPNTWREQNFFDFSYLDKQINRILQYKSDAKIIIMTALDGATWWTVAHPGAVADVEDAKEKGFPDLLSSEWRNSSRDVIRQLIAHISAQSYCNNVIGYELYNGKTMDCNFFLTKSGTRYEDDFKDFLEGKYSYVSSLRAAWNDSQVEFNTVECTLPTAEELESFNWTFHLLKDPADYQKYIDQAIFYGKQYQQVFKNFAADVKEATNGKALVGIRFGDFMGQIWHWDELSSPLCNDLLDDSNIDFFEVQETYPGRYLGASGWSVPVMPSLGAGKENKVIVIQNDIRTFLSPTTDYGYTNNLDDTIALQRRVIASSLAFGLAPYLYQLAYYYYSSSDPTNSQLLLDELKKEKEILDRSLDFDRSSGADVAFVFDRDYMSWYGWDQVYPYNKSRSMAFFDMSFSSWCRAGAPFDMIFLDQIDPQVKDYKVYVFFNMARLDSSERAIINNLKGNNRVLVFSWADGLIDEDGIDIANMASLIGMNIAMATGEKDWKMSQSSVFASWLSSQSLTYYANTPMGTMPVQPIWWTDLDDKTYAPAFYISDSNATSFATCDWDSSKKGVAVRHFSNWHSVYTSSSNIAPALLHYAFSLGCVHRYLRSGDSCYINKSFIGIHADADRTGLEIRLGTSGALYDIFNDVEYGPALQHYVDVDEDCTYLFFRGSKAAYFGSERSLLKNGDFGVDTWPSLGHPGSWGILAYSHGSFATQYDNNNPYYAQTAIQSNSTLPILSQEFYIGGASSFKVSFRLKGVPYNSTYPQLAIRVRENSTSSGYKFFKDSDTSWHESDCAIVPPISFTSGDTTHITTTNYTKHIQTTSSWQTVEMTIPACQNVSSYVIDLSVAGYVGGYYTAPVCLDDIKVTFVGQ